MNSTTQESSPGTTIQPLTLSRSEEKLYRHVVDIARKQLDSIDGNLANNGISRWESLMFKLRNRILYWRMGKIVHRRTAEHGKRAVKVITNELKTIEKDESSWSEATAREVEYLRFILYGI